MTPLKKESEPPQLDEITPAKTTLLSKLELSARDDEKDTEESDKENMLEKERQIARRRSRTLEGLADMDEEPDDYEAMLERERQTARRRSLAAESEAEQEAQQEAQQEVQTISLADLSTSRIPGTPEALLAARRKSQKDWQEWTARNQMREASKEAGVNSPASPLRPQHQESLQFNVKSQKRPSSIESVSDFQSVAGASMPGSRSPWHGGGFPQNIVSSPSHPSLAPGASMPTLTPCLMMPPIVVASPPHPMYSGSVQTVYAATPPLYSAVPPGMMLAASPEPLNYRCPPQEDDDDDADEAPQGSWFSSLFRR